MIFGISLSTITTGFFFILSLLMTRIFFKKAGLFNPFVLFFGIWFFDLFLYELDNFFGFLYLRMTDKADAWMTISFLCYFLGGTTACFLAKNSQKQFVVEKIELNFLYKLSKIILLFFTFSTICKYIILIKIYGNPLAILWKVRMDSYQGQLNFPYFLYFLTLPGYFLIINLGILTRLIRTKLILIMSLFTLFLAFLNSAAVGMRGEFMNFLLLYLMSITLTNIMQGTPIVLRRFIMIVLAMVLFVFLVSIILSLRSNGHTTLGDAFIRHSYIYLIGTIPAYSYFLDMPWPSVLIGRYTFGGLYLIVDQFLKIFGATIFSPEDMQTSYAPVTHEGPFNTSGYLTYFSSDFGELGLIILPYFLGFIVTYFFVNMLINKRIINIQIVSLLLVTAIYSIRGIFTSGVFFWTTIIFILYQANYLKSKIRYSRNHIKERNYEAEHFYSNTN